MMRANPGSYRTHALANQGEAGVGLLVGLAVIAVGGIAYLVLRPAPATTTAPQYPATGPAIPPGQTVQPPPPPALSPATSSASQLAPVPTKGVPTYHPYSGHHTLHGVEWLA